MYYKSERVLSFTVAVALYLRLLYHILDPFRDELKDVEQSCVLDYSVLVFVLLKSRRERELPLKRSY